MANIFSRRVAQRMKELGITQIELAKRIPSDQSTISRTLGESRNPRKETVAKWAKALETTPEWLVGEDLERIAVEMFGTEEPAQPAVRTLYQSAPGPSEAQLDAIVDMAAAIGVDDKRLDLIAFLLVAGEPAVSVLAKAKAAIRGADAVRLPGRKKGAV